MALRAFASTAAKRLGLRTSGLGSPGSLTGSTRSSTRTFASGGKGETYEGVTIHHASNWHKFLSQGFGGVMWFWIFYRLRHDYETFLFGHAAHFEHEIAHDSEH